MWLSIKIIILESDHLAKYEFKKNVSFFSWNMSGREKIKSIAETRDYSELMRTLRF